MGSKINAWHVGVQRQADKPRQIRLSETADLVQIDGDNAHLFVGQRFGIVYAVGEHVERVNNKVIAGEFGQWAPIRLSGLYPSFFHKLPNHALNGCFAQFNVTPYSVPLPGLPLWPIFCDNHHLVAIRTEGKTKGVLCSRAAIRHENLHLKIIIYNIAFNVNVISPFEAFFL